MANLDMRAPGGGAEFAAAGAVSGDGGRTMRQVTARIIPFLLVCYFISFLDRGNVAFAALQMNKDLGLNPLVFGQGYGLFFLTYCVFEIPSNLMLYKFGATRWIARIMLTWGICAAAMAFVVGPNSFYAVRLLLGAAEAGFFPGVLFFLTLWFPAAYRARIVGMFMAGVAISGVFGSPVSGFLLSLDGFFGLKGWQWLFILEGVPAIILAPLCLVFLQDGPAKATWLPAAGRDWLTATLAAERRQHEEKQRYSVLQTMINPRVLFLAAMYFANVCLLNAILAFLPLTLKSFGLTNVQVGFVGAIPSLVALVAVLWWGRRSDKAAKDRYTHAALANFVAGTALLLSAVLPDPTVRIIAITVSMASTLAFTAPFWTIPSSFLTGAASAGGFAVISSLGVLGGYFAPTIIGYIANRTGGDFRYGIGGVGALAIVCAIIFYLVGRAQQARRSVSAPAGAVVGD